MSSRKKFFLVFMFIILDMFLLIGFLVIRDATMLNNLKHEAEHLTRQNLTIDRYNTSLKTRGSYAEVERCMKEYLDQYALNVQEALAILQEEDLTKILSYDNYKKDGKEFKKSLKYLDDKQKEFNNHIEKINTMSQEKSIISYANKKIVDEYYLGLYKKFMLSNDMKKNFQETSELIATIDGRVNNIFDTSREILNFLVKNKESWKLEDNEIKFKTQDLYNKYTELIKKLDKKT